jgi:hypothetical protein
MNIAEKKYLQLARDDAHGFWNHEIYSFFSQSSIIKNNQIIPLSNIRSLDTI